MNWSAGLVVLVPPLFVTVRSTTPAEPAGDVAMIDAALLTVKLVALVAPNLTAVAPVKLVPVMATVVPPAVVPEVGDTFVTVGAVPVTVMVSVPVCVQLMVSDVT